MHMKTALIVETVESLFRNKPLSCSFATQLGRWTSKIRWGLNHSLPYPIKFLGYSGKVPITLSVWACFEFVREACFAYWLKRKGRGPVWGWIGWVPQDRQTKMSMHLRLSHMHRESTSSSDPVLKIFSWATSHLGPMSSPNQGLFIHTKWKGHH